MIQNPILPGFHPDPSICRVGDDFYLVTSSFSFFPGVPIFHSRDLTNWEQLGYVLDRPSQLPCSYEMLSGGIFAPTIRYHEGTFYMITTNMSMGVKNFIVTAERPEGPWSEMHIIEGADGIDPSLFFDEDGQAYYTGTTWLEEADATKQAIWCSRIDLKEMKLVGERAILGTGSMANSHAPEGPHLYKKDGWYYLMIAEGGTEHMHAVTISRSREVFGPYENYQGNPILTHRHLGRNYPICNVGHGDLVELPDGSYYMVMLASRLMDGYHKILGRETFLVPVEWEDGWPIVSPGTGKVENTYLQPECLTEQPLSQALPLSTDTDFDEALGMEWNQIGTPDKEFYKIEDSCLKLRLLQNELVPWELDGLSANIFERMPMFGKGGGAVSFLGRRQQHMEFEAVTKLYFSPKEEEAAGLVVIQNDANQLRVEYRRNADGKPEAACISTRTVSREGKQYFKEQTLGALPLASADSGKAGSADGDDTGIWLKMVGNYTRYSFYVSQDGEHYVPVAEHVDGSFMGSENSGGFIGAYIGLFAHGGQSDKEGYASFDSFRYAGL